MAVLRQAEADRVADRTVVLDLGDLQRQGEAVRAAARREADALLARAKAEREALLVGARAEGRAAGLAEGRAEGERLGREVGREAARAEHAAALATLDAAWASALAQFIAARDALLEESRTDVVRLALLLAQRVVRRRIESDPTLVVDQARAVLDALARPTRVTLAVHPQDAPALADALPTMLAALGDGAHVAITHDPSLSRGSCVLRTPAGGTIDASIDAQLARLAAALLGQPSTAAPAPPAGPEPAP